MVYENRCRKCGARLIHDARDGVCPKCLLEEALAFEPEEESGAWPVALTEQPGTPIGRYKLLEQLGEGGFGVVYMAEQEEPVRRRVALKIIKPGMDTKEVVARFEAERQALALMDHPNIAKVFDGGATRTGRPYFVMELVRGLRITEFCDRQQCSPGQRLELFMQVCQAVQHAHQKGIIHRDLKPSNILVTVNDGVPVPKVIDFGIAKATGMRLTDKTLFTRFLNLLGTPAYMSPEQVELTSLDVDTRSDIYSLGVLLYELLTGQTPIDARELVQAGVDEMRRRIREEEPPKPSTRLSTLSDAERITTGRCRSVDMPKLVHLIRGDLDWIVMKCLEKDRDRRYETANGLASDLQRHLQQQPIIACPPSRFYRFHKFVRRNKATVTASSAVVAVVVLGGLASAWQWRNAVLAQRGEEFQRKVAETNALQKRSQLVRLHVANGGRALETDDWFGALLWFTEALRHDTPGTRDESMHRYRIGAILQYAPRLTRVWFHQGPVNSVDVSLDGSRTLTASEDGTALVWNSASGQPVARLSHGASVLQAAFSADARRVLTVGQDGMVKIWNPETGRMVCPPLVHDHVVTFALLSPDGQRAFTGGARPTGNLSTESTAGPSQEKVWEVRIWDTNTGQEIRPAFHQPEPIRDLVLSKDGRWLAASLGWSAMVWDLRHPQGLHIQMGGKTQMDVIPGLEEGHPEDAPENRLPGIPAAPGIPDRPDHPGINRLAFSPDSQHILTGHNDNSARIWNLAQGGSVGLKPPKTRGRHERFHGVHFARFSPDGLRVILVDTDMVVRLWDARTGEALGQLEGKAWSPERFSPDGRYAYLSGKVWDMEADEGIPPGLLHPWLNDFAFCPDGMSFLTAGRDGTARLWNLAGGIAPLPPLRHDWGSVSAQLDQPEAHGPGPAQLDIETILLSLSSDVVQASFNSDSQRVVTASHNGSARVWDATTGQAITPYVFLGDSINFAGFNREGTSFVTAGGGPPDREQGLARIWDAQTGQPLIPTIKYHQQFKSAAFSPNGQWLITRTSQSAQIWNAQTGAPTQLPMILGGPIRTLAFNPDGNLWAACAMTGPRQGNEGGFEGQVQDSGSGNESNLLVSAGAEVVFQIRLWNAQTRQPVTPPLEVTNNLRHIEFSPDGRWLLTLAECGPDLLEARLWNAATGRPVTTPVRGRGFSPVATFTSDGFYCLILGLDVETVAWELPSGRALGPAEWRASKLLPRAVTADGQRVVTFKDGGFRVLDAVTGDPLTPVLQIDPSVFGPEFLFSPDGSRLLSLTGDHARLWPLPKDTRPVEALVLLAQLLSARQLEASGNYAEWTAASAVKAWETVGQKQGLGFPLTPGQAQLWRERQVEQAEAGEHWFTAAYQLGQLVKERPEDKSLPLRMARARNNLALEELK